MFRNNLNKQRTSKNSSKFVKISTFLIPHTISSVCFGCFDTGPPKQSERKNFLFREKENRKTTETDWVSVCFGSNREKKFMVLRTLFGDFFCLFRQNSVCFLFLYRSETPKQTEKNVFWFRKTNLKTTETDWVSVCFGSYRKKHLIVSRTP